MGFLNCGDKGMVNAFFKQMYRAVFKPQDYYILGKVKVANAAFYVLILSAVYSLIGIMYISSFLHIGRLADWIKFYSPDYQYSNGQLHSDMTYFNVIDDFGIYFDTEIGQMSSEIVMRFADEYEFDKGAIFTARSFWIYVKEAGAVEIKYSSFGVDSFDREWIIDNLDIVLGFVGTIMVILLCVLCMIIYFLSALVYLIIAILITMILKKQCSYIELFNVCLYAKTLMFIVEMICLWIPAVNTNGLVFIIISSVVSMIYIIIGIYRMHKYFPKQIRFGQ